MSKVNTRQKGKELERYVADQIIEKGLDSRAYARGDSGGGNKEKTDVSTSMMVLDQNAGIECKFAKNASVSTWWKQTKNLESLGYEPILAYKLNNEPFSETKVVIYLDTFLELIKASEGVEVVQEVDDPKKRAIRYKWEKAVYALKDLMKELE